MFALESIKPQSKACFLDLTASFEELRKEKEEAIQTSKSLYIIESVVKNYTGLTISILTTPFVGPAADIPMISKSHPLLNEFRKEYVNNRDYLKELITARKMFGSVSLATGKVSGIFANEINKIHFPSNLIKDNKFTSGELAAIMLHEIGHLITYYEYICRSVSTNQVLAALHRELANVDTPDKRTTLFMGLKDAINLTEEQVEDLNKCTNTEVINAIVLSSLVENSRSELGNAIYDTNSWEQLSDDYATRMQAGHDLVSALSKLYKKSGNVSFRSTVGYLAMEAIKLIMFFIALNGAVTGVFFFMLLVLVDGFGGGDYDVPGARFTRIRNQIISELKDPKLSKDEIERLNADLDLISELLQNVNDRRQFVQVLFNFIGFGRANRKHIQLQQDLEEIANNELFAKASKFKLIN